MKMLMNFFSGGEGGGQRVLWEICKLGITTNNFELLHRVIG